MSRAVAGRTHGCGDLRSSHVGETVTVCGWVANRRDHGAVSFIDLRDRFGMLQLVGDEDSPAEAHTTLQNLHPEDCLRVTGVVRGRDPAHVNKKRSTGEVELVAREVEVLSRSARVPFEISEHIDVPEEMRMTYRYLDLRRESMQRFMLMRSKANHAIRTALQSLDFCEVETPMLTKSTPEGARDYLVPSRVRSGAWYALPQSPQIFKQLCMIAGLDRYFQIARCLRDEDLRADRQPEFTQLDLEMSFVDEEDVFRLIEAVFVNLYREVLDIELKAPFERMPHVESMRRFASDKPDLRNPLEVIDLADASKALEFQVFHNALEAGGLVRGVNVPGGASLGRKLIDSIEQAARDAGAGGAAWCKVGENGETTGPLSRFLKDDAGQAFLQAAGSKAGDLLVTIADRKRIAYSALDAVRRKSGELMELGGGPDRLVWITEFPLFEENDDGSWAPAHHPFTSPVLEDLEDLKAGKHDGVRSRAYDLVLNGVELGSGSIRIHERDVQEAVFAAIGLDPEEARARFDFLLKAFDFGPPPHGGFAVGLDRLYSQLFDAESIRDVIAFPKTSTGACPLTGAPSPVDALQLAELGLTRRQDSPAVEEKASPI